MMQTKPDTRDDLSVVATLTGPAAEALLRIKKLSLGHDFVDISTPEGPVVQICAESEQEAILSHDSATTQESE